MLVIVGRGRVGRALAAAWGPRALLVSHDTHAGVPEGVPVVLAVPDAAIAATAARFPV